MVKRSLAAVMEAAEQMGVKVDNFEARELSDLTVSLLQAQAVMPFWFSSIP
jgi:hypothetical protein